MSAAKPLKVRNGPKLTAYVAAHIIVVGWMLVGAPTSWDSLLEVGTGECVKAMGTMVLGLLVWLLSRLGGSDLKARLVFGRWRDPLPGFRAFSEVAQNDNRVDPVRLQDAVGGGSLPTEPSEQNRAWYRLYRKFEQSEAVLVGHQEYLLFRDLTWLTLVLGLLAPTLLLAFCDTPDRALWDGFGCLLLFVLSRTAARVAGERFVGTVLAVASSAMPRKPSKIILPPGRVE